MIYRQSTILAKYSSFDEVRPDVLAAATERGILVHRAIAARLLGLYCPPLPEECRGYLVSFEKFEPMIKRIIAVEKTFIDEKLGISGTIDLLAEIAGTTGISAIDWKTPTLAYTVWAAQMAIYRLLSKADTCGTLQLQADGGTPKIIWHHGDAYALQAFLYALQAHKYFIGGND